MKVFAETVISSAVNMCYLSLFMLFLLSSMHSPNPIPWIWSLGGLLTPAIHWQSVTYSNCILQWLGIHPRSIHWASALCLPSFHDLWNWKGMGLASICALNHTTKQLCDHELLTRDDTLSFIFMIPNVGVTRTLVFIEVMCLACGVNY